MIKGLIRLVVLFAAGLGLAWAADRWLGGRHQLADGESTPDPIRSTVAIGVPIERVWVRIADIERQP
ncbi:MAG: hypothetical protein ACRDGI_01185, partial [Candidatus Limnocylindrales bacterium]